MVGSSKILTVSYGTFSCTLEGFDDPFSTMRSIAEYFRDLAADDRYFGAEPPTPDAEMLHRIAEREIQRRVEAKVDGDDVILRQIDSGLVEDESDLSASEALADTPVAATSSAEPPIVDIEDDFEEDEDGDLSEITADPAFEAEDEQPEEDNTDATIEDKLSRIRAVVERSRSRDLGAAAFAQNPAEQDDADDEADAADLAPGFGSDVDAGLIAQVLANDEASDEGEIGEFDAPETDDLTQNAVASEDEAADEVDTASEEGTAEVSFDENAADEDVVAEDTQPEEDAAAFDGDAGTDTDDVADSEIASGETDADEDPTSDADTQDAVARMMAEAASDLDEAMPGDEPISQDDADLQMVLEAVEADDAVPEETIASDDEIAETAEDASEAEADEADDEDEQDDLWDRDFDAEVAAEEAEDQVAEDGAIAAARAERPTSKSVHLKAPEEETERLQDQTETEFKENEGTRRRSAIAHLKAAVAATRADKILSRVVGRDHAGDPEEQKDYREDLSRVVRPSRPLSTPVEAGAPDATETEDNDAPVEEAHDEPLDEPMDGQPSPLMLVSELRVEEEAASDIPSSRIKTRILNEPVVEEDSGEFAAYAKRVGAHDLTDLLEAAAAYTVHVEQQPHFSRPQIMRRVAKVDPSIEESREAGLRSFGQLLRQGRIQKLQRGQFTVSDTTRFKPEQRIAGE